VCTFIIHNFIARWQDEQCQLMMKNGARLLYEHGARSRERGAGILRAESRNYCQFFKKYRISTKNRNFEI
jgi:hypothetical protein